MGPSSAALRPLKAGEILTWPRGTWLPFWTYGPTRGRDGWPATLRFFAQVGDDVLGDDFPTRGDAEEAVKRAVAERVDAWKAAHPEYRCEVPPEPDE